MSKRKEFVMLAAGILAELVLAPTAAHAAGEYLAATRSTQPIYVDGRQVQLEAYAINGSNYVKLRDIGQAVGFNVYWQDGVQIDTAAPYTGEAPTKSAPVETPALPAGGQPYTVSTAHWSRKDFSRAANPAVFTGVYSRELYNTFRQALVDKGVDNGPVAYTMVSKADYSAVKNLMGRLDGVLRYEHYVPENFVNYYEWLDYFAVSAIMPENYKTALEHIQPVITEVKQLKADRAKVEHLNDYLCSLLVYQKDKTAAIADIFSDHCTELPAACGTYARAFKFLCQAADIPCFTISTSKHVWNMVYADGKWLHVEQGNIPLALQRKETYV